MSSPEGYRKAMRLMKQAEKFKRPPWSSNYTVNINLEENYWASGAANLIEMQYPLIEFIANLR